MNTQAQEQNFDLSAELTAAPISMGSANLVMDANAMQQMVNLSNFMASARSTIPQHLQGNPGDCLAIIMQSTQWGMNPFAVAQKTHLVNGQLGYEGQLVNAVITARAPVQGRLQYEWFGEWSRILGRFKEVNTNGKVKIVKDWTVEDEKGLGIRVSATLKGEEEPRVLELLLSQAGVRNSPLWGQDPKQQLAYLAVKRWARLHCPDVILGVYTVDEFEPAVEKTITPTNNTTKSNSGSSSLKDRLKKKQETAIESTAIEVDFSIEECLKAISSAKSIQELKEIASAIPANLGEPAQTNINGAYKARKAELSKPQPFAEEAVEAVILEINSAVDLDILNEIMQSSFEPFTAQMTEAQISQISSAYDAQEAALTP
ncbi:RecT family recombinase [Acinetobacter cumulans]|nr:RecT family recombinase [Acinetobacter cumulans]